MTAASSTTALFPAPPVRGVVFDFHHTLVHGGDTPTWFENAWRDLGRDSDARTALGDDTFEAALAYVDRLWEHARVIDPDSERDLDAVRHREVYDRTVGDAPGVDGELADALYAVMMRQWDPYDDALPVLKALRDSGVRVVVLSNVGYDLSPVLDRTGIADHIDGVVMSYAIGAVKPSPDIFQRALDLLGLPAGDVLMVGDAWRDDSGAAALGIRTLILPRTDTPSHGLSLVLRVVGVRG